MDRQCNDNGKETVFSDTPKIPSEFFFDIEINLGRGELNQMLHCEQKVDVRLGVETERIRGGGG
jgi:hypothetical protein